MLKVDDALNANGGVGVDLWKVEENSCETLMFTLNKEEVVSLAKWLSAWLEENK